MYDLNNVPDNLSIIVIVRGLFVSEMLRLPNIHAEDVDWAPKCDNLYIEDNFLDNLYNIDNVSDSYRENIHIISYYFHPNVARVV